MSEPVNILVSPAGEVTLIYQEHVSLTALGPERIQRASTVEPDSAGRWERWGRFKPYCILRLPLPLRRSRRAARQVKFCPLAAPPSPHRFSTQNPRGPTPGGWRISSPRGVLGEHSRGCLRFAMPAALEPPPPGFCSFRGCTWPPSCSPCPISPPPDARRRTMLAPRWTTAPRGILPPLVLQPCPRNTSASPNSCSPRSSSGSRPGPTSTSLPRRAVCPPRSSPTGWPATPAAVTTCVGSCPSSPAPRTNSPSPFRKRDRAHPPLSPVNLTQ